MKMDFSNKVLEVCKLIPLGKVTTYKTIAEKINHPNSSRAIGNALNKNKDLIKIPCHRVIRSDGFVGGYAKGTKRKTALLRKEGVSVSDKGFVDLKKFKTQFDY